MGFWDVVEDAVNPKNLATVGGFALGGPLGAGIGRGLGEATFGDDWDWRGEDAGGVGEVLGNAAMGYGAGYMAPSSIGGGGGAGKFLSTVKSAVGAGGGGAAAGSGAGTVGGAGATSGASLGAGAGSTASGAGTAASGLGTLEKAALIGQGVGAAGDLYGSYQADKRREEARKRKARLAGLLMPYYADRHGWR